MRPVFFLYSRDTSAIPLKSEFLFVCVCVCIYLDGISGLFVLCKKDEDTTGISFFISVTLVKP